MGRSMNYGGVAETSFAGADQHSHAKFSGHRVIHTAESVGHGELKMKRNPSVYRSAEW